MSSVKQFFRDNIVVLAAFGVGVSCLLLYRMPSPIAADEPPDRKDSARGSSDWNRLSAHFYSQLQVDTPEAKQLPFSPSHHDPTLRAQYPPEGIGSLFKEKSQQETLSLLEEFIKGEPKAVLADPLKKALLQHDLWAMFDWISAEGWWEDNSLRRSVPTYRDERRDVYIRLADALKHLRLTEEDLSKLPDNYAAAVASENYPKRYDPAQKSRAFLPADLWETDGPWVIVSQWGGQPVAERHVRFFRGRSVFYTFLRLPEGRDATENYITKLRKWRHDRDPKDRNPPQFPPETQVALVRQMLALNKSGGIVPTPITELVQIRIIHDPSSTDDNAQSFLEFRLRRDKLLAGERGGLTVVKEDETERAETLFLAADSSPDRLPAMKMCTECHLRSNHPGILSIRSFTGGDGFRKLVDSDSERQQDVVIDWKQKRYSWGLLTGLWEGSAND